MHQSEEMRSMAVFTGTVALLVLMLMVGSSHHASTARIAGRYHAVARAVSDSVPDPWPQAEQRVPGPSQCEPAGRIEDDFGIVRRNHDEMVRCTPRGMAQSGQAGFSNSLRGFVL